MVCFFQSIYDVDVLGFACTFHPLTNATPEWLQYVL